MTTTTHADFNQDTEALEVAKAFPESIQGKTILITGVNRGGLGFTTAQALASQGPSNIILASRTPSKIEECIKDLKSEYPDVKYRALELDLSNQKAVRHAATEVLSWTDIPAIDIAINNAAVMNIPERTLNEDGIEMHFATNHIGHFLFTSLIMSKFLKAAEGIPKGATRIVNVTSLSPTVASMRWSDINFDKINKELPEAEQPPYEMHKRWGISGAEDMSYLPLEGYNQSKVANVLFSIGLNKRLFEKFGILSVSCHPGVIRTELGRYASPEMIAGITELLKSGAFHMKTLEAGAATSVVSALDPKLTLPYEKTDDGKENYGVYLMDCQISDKLNPRASSSSEAEKLWTLSEQLVKGTSTW